MTNTTNTTEQFIQRVRDLVVERGIATGTLDADTADRLRHVKLLYGVGDGSYRGVCIYDAWENGVGRVDVVEIAATGQESWVQLAGTVIHELGHVLAGRDAGHGPVWKATAASLGFVKHPAAAGQHYTLGLLDSWLRERIYELAVTIGDGTPAFRTIGLGALGILPVAPRPCSAGVGSRGGKSRGKGSGSRMRLYECSCEPKPVKIRAATDELDCTCNVCGSRFEKVEKAEPDRGSADSRRRLPVLV